MKSQITLIPLSLLAAVDVTFADWESLPGFPVALEDVSGSSPQVVDIDGDGKKEIFFGDEDGYLHFLTSKGEEMPGWPHQLGTTLLHSDPAFGDIDGDGQGEIVVGAFPSMIHALKASGKPVDGFPMNSGSPGASITFAAGVTLADIDGDGMLEVFLVGISGTANPPASYRHVIALDGRGKTLSGWPVVLKEPFLFAKGKPLVADMTGDGEKQVIAMADDGNLHVFSKHGELAPGWPQKLLQRGGTDPIAVDLDRDGALDVVAFGHALKVDGSPVSGWPLPNPDFYDDFAVAADLNRDGDVEIILGSLTSISIVSSDGKFLTDRPIPTLSRPNDLLLVDLDGDGVSEIITTHQRPAQIAAYKLDGSLFSGWPITILDTIPDTQLATPTIADIDGDAFLDIAFGTFSKQFFVYKLNVPDLQFPESTWLEYGRDALNSSVFPIPGRISLTLFSDADGDDIADPDEKPILVLEPGGTGELRLRTANRSRVPETLSASFPGLPAGWTATLDPPAPFTVEAGRDLTARLRVQAPLDAAVGPFSFEVSLRSAGGRSYSATAQVLLVQTPVISGVTPEDGSRIASEVVEVRWSTTGPSVGRLYLSRDGVPGSERVIEDVSLGTNHLVALSGLEDGAYRFQIEAEAPGLPPGGTSCAPPRACVPKRTFTLERGVIFTERKYRFEVLRDYDQPVEIPVVNLAGRELAVRFRLLEPLPEDLRVGFDRFTEAGDLRDRLVLAPGAGGAATLGLHAQDAQRDLYTLLAEVRTDDAPPLLDQAEIEVRVRTVHVDFDLELVGGNAPGTLIQKLRLTNRGEALTDLEVGVSALVAAGLDPRGRVAIVPGVSHGFLPPGGVLDLEAVPSLGPDLDLDFLGTVRVTARAFRQSREALVTFQPPPGESLFLAEARDRGVCATGADWYCTNRPRIQIPLTFPGGFATVSGGGTLTLKFAPSSSWHVLPHKVEVYLNGEDAAHRIDGGLFDGTFVPSGSYEFPVPAGILSPAGANAVTNTVYLHSRHNAGHYVVTSGATLCVCPGEAPVRRYLYARDQAQADERLRLYEGLNWRVGNLAVALDPIPAPRVGRRSTIRARVSSEGIAVPGLLVTALVVGSPGIIPLHFDGAAYSAPWVPAAEGSYRIEVTASACGSASKGSIGVTVTRDPCDELAAALNRGFHFYERCCEHQGEGCSPRQDDAEGVDAPKPFPDLEADDAWVLGLYPAAAELFSGPELECRFDPNRWYATGKKDPSGATQPEFEFSGLGLLPRAPVLGASLLLARDSIRGALGWLEGSVHLKGMIAHARDLGCGADGLRGEAVLELESGLLQLPDAEIPGRLDFRYDPRERQFRYAPPPLLRGDLPAPGFSLPEEALEVFGLELLAEPGVSASGKVHLGFRGIGDPQAPETLRLPDAGVLGLLAEADLRSNGKSAQASGSFLEVFFDAPPLVSAEGVGTARVLLELAYSRRDLVKGEVLFSPFEDGPAARSYSGLRALRPVVLLRARVEGDLRRKVSADFRGPGGETEVVLPEPLGYEKEILVPLQPIAVSGEAGLSAAGGGSIDDDLARLESASEVALATIAPAGEVGEGGGLYDLRIFVPVMLDLPAEKRVHQLEVLLGSQLIYPGEKLRLAVPLRRLAAEFRARVEGGEEPEEAGAAVAMTLDLDSDGIPDVRDRHLDLGAKAGTGLSLSPNLRLPWSVGIEGQLEAWLVTAGKVDGQQLTFSVDGVVLGSASVDPSTSGTPGRAVFPYTPPTQGLHRVEVSFAGSAGLLASVEAVEFTARRSAPRVKITSPAGAGVRQGPVRIEALVSGVAPIEVCLKIDGAVVKEAGGACAALPHLWDTGALSGVHWIEVTARDSLGQEARDLRPVLIGTPLFVRGDCNENGAVDLSDAVCILSFLYLGATEGEACRKALDIDDNGRLEITDSIALLNWLYLGGNPPVYPALKDSQEKVTPLRCGPDPTPDDALECREFRGCP